ncbi:hypothetical protein D3C72_1859260 [compost metagenome]
MTVSQLDQQIAVGTVHFRIDVQAPELQGKARRLYGFRQQRGVDDRAPQVRLAKSAIVVDASRIRCHPVEDTVLKCPRLTDRDHHRLKAGKLHQRCLRVQRPVQQHRRRLHGKKHIHTVHQVGLASCRLPLEGQRHQGDCWHVPVHTTRAIVRYTLQTALA